MSIFQKLFSSHKQSREKSAWELTVEAMHDRDLDCFDGVAEAIYSKDGARRFVLLQGEDGRFRYEYQELTPYTPEEQEFFALMGKDSAAYWSVDCTRSECPGYQTREDALRQLRQEKEFKKYFSEQNPG